MRCARRSPAALPETTKSKNGICASSSSSRSKCSTSARGSTATPGTSQSLRPCAISLPNSAATAGPPLTQITRCCASVSQNQSAESEVRWRKRSSERRSAWLAFWSRRRALIQTPNSTTPPVTSSSASIRFDQATLGVVHRGRRGLEDFLDGGDARRHLHRAADAQRLHALAVGELADLRQVGAGADHRLDRAAVDQRLVDADAAGEAGHAAFEAADRLVDRVRIGGFPGRDQAFPGLHVLGAVQLDLLLAVLAEDAH